MAKNECRGNKIARNIFEVVCGSPWHSAAGREGEWKGNGRGGNSSLLIRSHTFYIHKSAVFGQMHVNHIQFFTRGAPSHFTTSIFPVEKKTAPLGQLRRAIFHSPGFFFPLQALLIRAGARKDRPLTP